MTFTMGASLCFIMVGLWMKYRWKYILFMQNWQLRQDVLFQTLKSDHVDIIYTTSEKLASSFLS